MRSKPRSAKALDVGAVHVRISAHQHPALEVLGAHHARHLLELLRRADVALAEAHAEVRPLGEGVLHRLLVGRRPAQVQAEDLGHRARIATRLFGTLGEALQQHPELVGRCGLGDEAVDRAAGALGGDGAGCGDQDLGSALGHRPEAGRFEAVVLALVADVLAAVTGREQLLDDVDGLEHAVDALGGVGPVGADDVLVERFAAAEAEPVAVRVHGGEGRGCLRDHRGMHAEGGCGDAGAEVACGALAECAQDIPDEGCLTLLRDPGLEVVGGHDAGKPCCFCCRGELEDLGGVELLQHRGVADLRLRLRG